MAAETARSFEALEAQAQSILSVFTKAGHELVAPAVIQPADVFLDVIGESLRARTYVFTDPDGAELCLRPDLTVPTCRLHLARYGNAPPAGKYCYNGPTFRFQAQGADASHPREFRQAGVERFGDVAREAAEAETVALILRAIEKAGCRDWTLHLGDLGLFNSVLDVAALSPRWKKRIGEAFLKPLSFRQSLRRFETASREVPSTVPSELLARLDPHDISASTAVLAEYLDGSATELIGTRSLADIAEHLLAIGEVAHDARLDPAAAALISSYVAVSGPARTAGQRVAELVNGARNGSEAALETYDRRLALFANAGIDLDRVTFSAEFGRSLAYYTGLIFEVRHRSFSDDTPIAGGGRYDNVMRAAGASADVPAVGGAIHTERLLSAIAGARS